MEPVEDTAVEAAILWLAQAILSSLLLDKLDAWLRQVELADDTEKLKSEVERVEAVVDAVKGRATGSRPLARSLARLKELLYDADDVVDELDYYRLQHQVEGVTWRNPEGRDGDGAEQLDESRGNADIPSSGMGQKRSKYWGYFNQIEFDNGKAVKARCKYCDKVLSCPSEKGTSVLSNHLKSDSCKRKQGASDQPPNLSRAGDGELNGATVATGNSVRRKRMRTNEAPTHSAATSTHPWSKAEFRAKIQQMTLQLQQATSEILKLYGPSSVVCSNPDRNTTADPRRRTSSLVQRKMYGRVAEKNSIIKLMKEHKSVGVIVVPIVGIGGIGKTALAQNIYNDPDVTRQFEQRIWVWVSNRFDEVRLTREILEYVSQQRQEGISSFARLQEILMSQITSKRFLLILDDVWDDMDDHTWNELLAPLKSDNTKGNTILVTTRKYSIAKRIGTVKPVKLGALQNDDFLLLFKACTFGGDNYKGYPSLNIIADQIAKKLHGNPLAAETIGVLLREHLTTDHWNKIVENENWKSLQSSEGIMNALKLSYDQLPYYIQQCFLYCSIFPNNHRFLSMELVKIWISQGFVKSLHSSQRLEDIGRDYLTDLVDSGFFEQVERKESTPIDQTCYVMCAIMHDFARMLSRTEWATIDGLEFNAMPPTIRHLSILTDTAYNEDLHGSILRNKKFEEKIQSAVTTVTKLRTLVLIGKYDPFFFETFIDIIQKAQYLRVLQIVATYADFNYLCNSVKSTHIRYLRLEKKGSSEALPIPLSNFYHLQVLDARHATIPNDLNGLVSMRHLVVKKGAHVMDQNSICFDMTQLQSMNELVQLGMYQLQNVNGAEASSAKLRNKQHLEKMHLSWKNIFSQEESLPMNNSNSNPVSEHFADTARDVLEGLEPYHNLKHLQISGYSGATSPAWLGTSVTCLHTLHLEDCGEWQKLPYLGSMSSLTKLKLRNMQKVIEVWIPSLEELALIEMPKLERCSCNSVMDLNSSLRILKIMRCRALKAFSPFESRGRLKTEQDSWLSHLRELTIHDCPHLTVPKPLPPSSSVRKLSIAGVPTLPTMEGSSSGELIIGEWGSLYDLKKLDGKDLSFHNLWALTRLEIKNSGNISISFEDFRQLISLKSLEIVGCEKLFSVVPLEQTHEDTADANLNALPSLQYLRIFSCGIAGKWLSVMLRHAPALQELHLGFCQQISGLLMDGKENSLSSSAPPSSNLIPSLKKMLVAGCPDLTFEMSKEGFSGFTSLEELTIWNCPELVPSLVHKDENNDQGNGRWLLPHSLVKLRFDGDTIETLQLCFQENRNCLKELEVTGSSSLKCLQLHSCTALEELSIQECESLADLDGISTCLKTLILSVNQSLKSLQLRSCTALEKLSIEHCHSLAELEVNSTWLKELELSDNESLESVQLHCCTALEELEIRDCDLLAALEGLQSLSDLRQLRVSDCPGLPPCLERLPSTRGYELFPRLESLEIDDHSFLTTSFCTHLTSLQRLEISDCEEVRILTDEKERALQFLESLKELSVRRCENLAYLPVGLHSLPSLKRLEIYASPCILRLPETGLPPSLEELEINFCSKELADQCRMLATGKLKVKIGGKYVN